MSYNFHSVTLDKLFKFSDPHFPRYKVGIPTNSLVGRLNKCMVGTQYKEVETLSHIKSFCSVFSDACLLAIP